MREQGLEKGIPGVLEMLSKRLALPCCIVPTYPDDADISFSPVDQCSVLLGPAYPVGCWRLYNYTSCHLWNNFYTPGHLYTFLSLMSLFQGCLEKG